MGSVSCSRWTVVPYRALPYLQVASLLTIFDLYLVGRLAEGATRPNSTRVLKGGRDFVSRKKLTGGCFVLLYVPYLELKEFGKIQHGVPSRMVLAMGNSKRSV